MTAELQTTEQTTEQTTAQALIQILTLNKNTGAALEKLLKLPLLDADNKIPAGVLRIVGALSDGHIIESGDNANGNYVRFADGTQICWSGNIAATATNAMNKNAEWTFPAQFFDTDIIVTGSPRRADNYAFFLGAYNINSGLEVTMVFISNVAGFTNTIPVNCIAIGKWK